MATSLFTQFRELHTATLPLLLPNAWDAASALLFQRAGAAAIGTSSAALAWSLGYPDGGALPRHELLAAIKRLVRVLAVPLTIDIEDGYSSSPEIVAELAADIAQCGVVGINIEDGADQPELLCKKIAAIRARLGSTALFINARTDVFLRALATESSAVSVTIARLTQYHDAGANCGFVPGMIRTEDAHKVSTSIGMPLNLMALPGMPPIPQLAAAGVHRLSVGPALFQAAYGHASHLTEQFLKNQNMSNLYDTSLDYDGMNALFQQM